ncbi:hypothetical protein HII31_00229 [Pseudocercospora fuligena]|uniref:DUF6604 domain-containing protein n=1 Tax=Pseudocercospora fuligena TaxID=685502 RepID=A0A8H6VNM5_9PEZI|nr:hypothetical protein HII31_00229 [Pseudocercospora fuligena]
MMQRWIEKPAAGSYHRYKRGTQKVTDWLIETSKQIENTDYLVCTLSRKQHITTHGRLVLARGIAEARQPVPADILDLLSEVIEARHEFTIWFESEGQANSESTDSHRIFNKVLEDVYQQLSPLRQERSTPVIKAKRKKRPKRPTIAQSTFAVLEVEETCDANEVVEQEDTMNVPANDYDPTQATDQFQHEELDEGCLFELWCFLKDLHEIRYEIVVTWKAYLRAEVSDLVAAQTMEVGFNLARSAYEEFLARRPAVNTWGNALHVLCELEPGTLIQKYSSDWMDTLVEKHSSRLILLCPGATAKLFEIRKAYERFKKNLRTVGNSKFASEKTEFDFKAYLVDMTRGIYDWATIEHDLPGQTYCFERSEFIDALAVFCKTGLLPIWLVVSFAIYCDVFEVIGDRPYCIADAYLREMNQCIRKMEDFEKGTQKYRMQQLDPQWRDVRCMQALRVFRKDTLYERTSVKFKSNGTCNETENEVRVKSIMALPCASGIMLWHAKLLLFNTGIDIAKDLSFILCLAHIYTACRRYGLLRSTWSDMEFVIAQHKSTAPLVMKPNDTDPFTHVKHFLLALGIPITQFSRGKIPNLPPIETVAKNLKSAARPTTTSPYLILLKKLKSESGKTYFKRGEYIETVLTRLSQQDNPSPVNLLRTFKSHLIKDEPHINFDYLGFWSKCQEMYLKILGVVRGQKKKHCFREDVKILPHEFTHQILLEAATTKTGLVGTMMGTVGAVMGLLLNNEEGDRFSSEALGKSSGSLKKKSVRESL